MKCSTLLEKATAMNPMNATIPKILNGLTIFFVIFGNFLLNQIPSIRGIPRRIKTVWNICHGSIANSLNRGDDFKYRPPQRAKFNGVNNRAPAVANAVRDIDKAVFAFAMCDMKLLILPPGQAATKIIPRAIAGVGLISLTKRKVIPGSKMNWLKIPTNRDFGFVTTFLNCSNFKSSAIPNIIIARVIFIIVKPPGLKFRRIESRTVKS